jgi:thiol-disulfide isomerase/thioredoxin
LLAFASKANVSVVDFHATWCGPCINIAPHVHDKSKETGVQLIKVDVDKNGDASAKYGIQAMPTFAVIDSKGVVLLKKTGGSKDVVNEIFGKALKHK